MHDKCFKMFQINFGSWEAFTSCFDQRIPVERHENIVDEVKN